MWSEREKIKQWYNNDVSEPKNVDLQNPVMFFLGHPLGLFCFSAPPLLCASPLVINEWSLMPRSFMLHILLYFHEYWDWIPVLTYFYIYFQYEKYTKVWLCLHTWFWHIDNHWILTERLCYWIDTKTFNLTSSKTPPFWRLKGLWFRYILVKVSILISNSITD